MATFQAYLSPDEDGFAENQRRFHDAFAQQRANIARAVEALKLGTVVCFGAGVLNDIPMDVFFRSGAEVHLVDWINGVIEFGLAAAIVSNTRDGPECMFCELDEAQAAAYCGSFSKMQPDAGVCLAYVPTQATTPGCESYERGGQPKLHRQDVTGGFAQAFGDGAAAALAGVESWRQAFRRGSALARKAKGAEQSLDLADGSVDFITASMLISQFESEPYAYFSRLARETLGAPSGREEKRLKGSMETLRSDLLATQVARLGAEIHRLLTPKGRCYLSFEMFHRGDAEDGWHLVNPMVGALEQIADQFQFDFETVPESAVVSRFNGATGSSVIHQYLLRRKD